MTKSIIYRHQPYDYLQGPFFVLRWGLLTPILLEQQNMTQFNVIPTVDVSIFRSISMKSEVNPRLYPASSNYYSESLIQWSGLDLVSVYSVIKSFQPMIGENLPSHYYISSPYQTMMIIVDIDGWEEIEPDRGGKKIPQALHCYLVFNIK